MTITAFPLAWPPGWKRAGNQVEIQLQEWAGSALVDLEDAAYLVNFSWYAHRQRTNVYARTDVWNDGQKISTTMHQIIMGRRDGYVIDHDNGVGLDNRKANLRWATVSQNAANRVKRGRHSAFRGVTVDVRKAAKPWVAQITKDYRHINLGTFDDELTAAAAYDLAARALHGQFARLNLDLLYLKQDSTGAWVPAIEGARQ